MNTGTGGLDQLSPFQLKDRLIRYARAECVSGAATHKFLNAGRGNPNWVATTPREAFFLLGQFALAESKRVWDEWDIGGMPDAEGIAGRLDSFLSSLATSPGSMLLRGAIDYGKSELGFNADAFVHELTDAVIGDNYPEPDRMLTHAERVVQRYLAKTMCEERPPPGAFDLFAVEGGTAAMCYVFSSLRENRLLHTGDTIALGTPIFTPYIELPRLEDFSFPVVEIAQSRMASDHHAWQYSDAEIDKLADPKIKAFFLVNPSNPASFAMHPATQQRLVDLVRNKRPDLIILTDDVYGTFAEGFRSLAADLPRNTVLVYSYSKHFGCTGWRLGVIGVHQENIFDERIAALPERDRLALRKRYGSLTMNPDGLKFIDRLVADSRDVALNHTAGLSLPQQAQMTLFSLFALLDRDDAYQRRCRQIVKERLGALSKGLGLDIPEDPLRVAYYVDLDLAVWGRQVIGEDFAHYVAAHHAPLDLVIDLAQRHGSVLLNGSGFEGPPWSVRVSLANLDADAYEAIGRDLKAMAQQALEEWRRSKGPQR
ncbi:aspartate aminotransferase [Steroidobacter agaridevorans]|uniref:Aspartate 4-decarboxylase n=1 Tax=Steroidobacter agaridevorans TaxID=2695856 RepID=A0A829YB42_9GAMM|nr:bifunctional aspartate transaminase/aspartate 4-decarboxylase [Steroidobacter agaridevorans]GFE80335.1 aspartate aminotransferase [Steroidobacter agaridevorans]